MPARFSFSLAVFCLFCLSMPRVFADGPRLPFQGKMQDATDSPRRLLAENGGFRMYSVPSHLRVTRKSARAGQGQGGGLAGLSTTQVAYSDPVSGNAVLLTWDETTANSSGVNVFVDGFLVGPVPGLSAPGTNSTFLEGFPEGLFTLRIESIDDGSTSEATQMFLGAQPFADAGNIQCGPGEASTGASCDLDVDWENPGPVPEVYVLIVNGETLGTVPGDVMGITIENAPPGDYTVSLVGFNTDPDGQGEYRGRFVETSCPLDCTVAPPIETPLLEEIGLLALVAILLGLGCWMLRRAQAAAGRA